MVKKFEPALPPDVPKPVMAVEYKGELYPCLQSAEGARAKADLMGVLLSDEEANSLDQYSYLRRHAVRQAVDRVVKNAERVHGILSRYLAAAKA